MAVVVDQSSKAQLGLDRLDGQGFGTKKQRRDHCFVLVHRWNLLVTGIEERAEKVFKRTFGKLHFVKSNCPLTDWTGIAVANQKVMAARGMKAPGMASCTCWMTHDDSQQQKLEGITRKDDIINRIK